MTHLVIINGNLNVRQYIDEILNPVVLPFMNNMGENAVFQDDMLILIVHALSPNSCSRIVSEPCNGRLVLQI